VAEEVAGAAVALGVGEAHARPAAGAEEGALQVVVVLAVALLGVRVSVEHGAGAAERLLAHERLVLAVVVDAGVADGADVVGVAKHRRELSPRNGLLRLGRRRPRAQAALGQRRLQRVKRVGA
jgi:hypothetical protein